MCGEKQAFRYITRTMTSRTVLTIKEECVYCGGKGWINNPAFEACRHKDHPCFTDQACIKSHCPDAGECLHGETIMCPWCG